MAPNARIPSISGGGSFRTVLRDGMVVSMPRANNRSAEQPFHAKRVRPAAVVTTHPDFKTELEEIVRALARAAARKDHAEALEADAMVPTEADCR